MSEHNISWGKVIKGAAIATGVVLTALLFLPEIMTLATGAAASATALAAAHAGGAGVASALAHAGTGAAAWLATQGASLVGWVAAHEAKTITLGAIIGGLTSDASQRIDEIKDARREAKIGDAADNAFAAREDMRRMQALMQIRMQAAGMQPAMAGPARG